MVKIGDAIKYYGIAYRCMLLILRYALVVCVSLRMPYFSVAEIITLRIS